MSHYRLIIFGIGTLTAILCASACDEKVTEPPDPDPDPPAPVDREPLLKLYEATSGPSWINDDGWNTDAPMGEWYGVETDGSGRVVSLDLSGTWDEENLRWKQRHGLSGPIPPELGNLTSLKSLVLAGNQLEGELPSELGILSELTRLDLGSNSLTGAIPPEFGDIYQLTELDLQDNNLRGAIPSELGRVRDLTLLNLSRNTLSSIPSELGHLSGLRVLLLSENSLVGGIPEDLGRLSELHTLSISHNPRLAGPTRQPGQPGATVPPWERADRQYSARTRQPCQRDGPVPQ